jgi:hypothetical protein
VEVDSLAEFAGVQSGVASGVVVVVAGADHQHPRTGVRDAIRNGHNFVTNPERARLSGSDTTSIINAGDIDQCVGEAGDDRAGEGGRQTGFVGNGAAGSLDTGLHMWRGAVGLVAEAVDALAEAGQSARRGIGKTGGTNSNAIERTKAYRIVDFRRD